MPPLVLDWIMATNYKAYMLWETEFSGNLLIFLKQEIEFIHVPYT